MGKIVQEVSRLVESGLNMSARLKMPRCSENVSENEPSESMGF
jgi:hypothetical protein